MRYKFFKGVFKPKKLDTLREEAKKYIGKEVYVGHGWKITKSDGGDYVGQWALVPAWRGVGWIPEEDIENLEEITYKEYRQKEKDYKKS